MTEDLHRHTTSVVSIHLFTQLILVLFALTIFFAVNIKITTTCCCSNNNRVLVVVLVAVVLVIVVVVCIELCSVRIQTSPVELRMNRVSLQTQW